MGFSQKEVGSYQWSHVSVRLANSSWKTTKFRSKIVLQNHCRFSSCWWRQSLHKPYARSQHPDRFCCWYNQHQCEEICFQTASLPISQPSYPSNWFMITVYVVRCSHYYIPCCSFIYWSLLYYWWLMILFTDLWLTPLTTLIDILDCPISLYISHPTPFIICCSRLTQLQQYLPTHETSTQCCFDCAFVAVFSKALSPLPRARLPAPVVVDFSVWARTCYPDLVPSVVWPGVW